MISKNHEFSMNEKEIKEIYENSEKNGMQLADENLIKWPSKWFKQ